MDTNINNKIIDLVKRSIKYYLEKKEFFRPNEKDYTEEVFQQKRGVFVTIMVRNNLRGCIGCIEPDNYVYQLIARNAVEAAFFDPRFYPLTQEEFEDCDLEVSVLTEPKDYVYDNFEVLLKFLDEKKPGLVIEKDSNKATFLPSVWEELHEPEDFLSHLCLKAGLEHNIWKKDKIDVQYYFTDIYKS